MKKHNVTIISQGNQHQIDVLPSQTILDAVLASGITVPFACTVGVCGTCRAKMTEGNVYMPTNYGLEDEEVAEGYILTCQAQLISDTAMVDFD